MNEEKDRKASIQIQRMEHKTISDFSFLANNN